MPIYDLNHSTKVERITEFLDNLNAFVKEDRNLIDKIYNVIFRNYEVDDANSG